MVLVSSLLRSISTPEEMEARLLYALKDGDTPEKSFIFSILTGSP
jgi:hypothetical protein